MPQEKNAKKKTTLRRKGGAPDINYMERLPDARPQISKNTPNYQRSRSTTTVPMTNRLEKLPDELPEMYEMPILPPPIPLNRLLRQQNQPLTIPRPEVVNIMKKSFPRNMSFGDFDVENINAERKTVPKKSKQGTTPPLARRHKAKPLSQ